MKLSVFAVLVGVLICISLDCAEAKKSQDDLEFLDDEGDFGSGQGNFKSIPGKRRSSPARIDDEDDGEGSGSGAGPVIKPQPPPRGPDRPQPRVPQRAPPIDPMTTTTTTTTEAPEEEEPEPEGDNEDNEDDQENEDDIDNEEEEEEEEYDDNDKDDDTEVFVPPPETPAPTVRPVVPDIVETSQEEEEDDEVEPDEPLDISRDPVFPGPDSGRKASEEDIKEIDEDDDSDKGLVPVDPGRELPPVQAPPSEEIPEGGEPGKDVHVYGPKEDSPTSFFAQPGILAAIVGGAVVGLLFAILVVMFIVYRMRKKDEGSYILDEKRSPTSNSYSKSSREFYA